METTIKDYVGFHFCLGDGTPAAGKALAERHEAHERV